MKRIIQNAVLVLLLISIIGFASPVKVSATSLDDLNSGNTGGSQTESNVDHGSGGNSSLTDYLRGYNPISSESMEKASTAASPIVSFLGTVAGFIVAVTSAGIFVVTALDLMYIAIPPVRSLLNPAAAMGGAGASPMGGMGGMGMGMGMRGGMMGGMGGMAGGAGGGGAMPEQGLRRKWVSDEAVYCVNLANMQTQPQGGGAMGGMGGMGGMGMMGGMGGMSPMMGGGAPSTPMPMKSVILEYLKKRTFFLIIFFVCTVVLFSSIIMDCGLNLGELVLKLFGNINNNISGVSF